jgi:hypothetical protein
LDNIAISVFDSKFFEYAVRMYSSLRAFNPAVRAFAGDLGLSQGQRSMLEALGVGVLQCERARVLKDRGLSPTLCDFLLHAYLKDISWDKVVWIDADTLILDDISAIFSHDTDIVAHPGRSSHGPIYSFAERYRFGQGEIRDWIDENLPCSEDSAYFAAGVWCTRSRSFLKFLDSLLDRVPPQIRAASPVFAAAVHNQKLSYHQLEPAVWNFGRELIYQARFEAGRIVYGEGIHPKIAAFSYTDKGEKPSNAELDRFFDLVVRRMLPEKSTEDLIRFVTQEKYTQSGPDKLRMLDRLVRDVVSRDVPGDLVECGVWRGGSALVSFNAAVSSQKNIHLFDTFEGMPAPTAEDYKTEGESYPGSLRKEGGTFGKGSLNDTSDELVHRLFDMLGMDLQRLRINKGYLGVSAWHVSFLDKLLEALSRMTGRSVRRNSDLLCRFPERICFLHIDLDFYQPYKWALHHLYRRVPHGGAIVFDDYGHWIGAKRAIDEFLKESGQQLEETPGTSQWFVVKKQKVYVDLDDFCEEYVTDRHWQLLGELRRIYPDFKVTMFTIPGKSSPAWLRWVKKEYPWIEMAVHGTLHGDKSEWLVSGKTLAEGLRKVRRIYSDEIYCRGFKAPWWNISKQAYDAFRKAGFFVGTNKTNLFARSSDVLNYAYDAGDEVLPDIHYRHAFFDTWHGHVQSQRKCNPVLPNGLEDIFDRISKAWPAGTSFGFVSELFAND